MYQLGLATEAVTNLIKNSDESINNLTYKKEIMLDLGLISANEAVHPGDKAIPRTSAGRARLVNALFKDVILKKNTDFGSIPLSKGNIADFQYYEKMSKCMQLINSNGNLNREPNVIRMNELHEALVSDTDAFEYGFKLNIDVIVYTYCTLVAALMDIIQINITLFIKDAHGESVTAPASNYKLITKSVDSFLDIRKSGEWRKLINSYKKSYSRNAFGTVVLIAAVSIIGVVALINVIRNLIFLYYNSAVTIDEKARSMEAYLAEVMPYEKNEKALKKQQKASARLASIAGTIETKIIKDTQRAESELNKSSKNISVNAFTPSNDVTEEENTAGFTFM